MILFSVPIAYVDENIIEELFDIGNNNFVKVVPCGPCTSATYKEVPRV